MEILNSDLQAQLIGFIQVIIGGCLSIGSIYVVILINKYTSIAKEKLQSVQDENAKKQLNTALDRLNNLLVSNITNAEATLKKEIINGISDGKFTKEDLSSLKESVVTNVLGQLNTDATELLTKEVGDLKTFTEVKLEEILANLKDNPNSSVQHTEL